MRNELMRAKTWIGVVVALAAYRVLPHPTNVSPMIAFSLLAGSRRELGPWSFLIAPLAMLISDATMQLMGKEGFHVQMISVYGSLMLSSAVGRALSEKTPLWGTAFAGALSSTLFFMLTNFSVWLLENMYPKNADGLSACFIAALPFYERAFLADVLFTVLTFFAASVVTKRRGVLSHSGLFSQNA